MINSFEYTSEVGLSYNDLEFLYQELESTWDSFKIPSFHREIFSKYTEVIVPNKIPVLIAQEITSIEKGFSPIIHLLQSISNREKIIGKFKGLDEKFRKARQKEMEIIELEAANMVRKMRMATAKVMKNIQMWKRQFIGVDCDYYWNQICYIEKIKHDMDFLRVLGRMTFIMRDPFFLNTDITGACQKARAIFKLSVKELKKYKKMQKSISYGIEDLPVIQLSQAQTIVGPDYDHVFSCKILTRKEVQQLQQMNFEIACEVFIELTDLFVNEITMQAVEEQQYLAQLQELTEHLIEIYIEDIVKIDSLDVFNSFLLEHSEIILENYIGECVDGKILEPISWKSLLVHNIACDICDSLTFFPLIKSAFSEIREENELLVQPIYFNLFSDMFYENWVTKAIENTLRIEKYKAVHEKMPLEVLKIFNSKHYYLLIEALPDEIYYDIMNEYVGNKWIASIIKSSMDEIKGKDEAKLSKLMPI
ncbi:hypothetical protein SteCoe_24895 [Stentor coeruleus]|uniref:Uncharacterized protein n=1 Tax=Stentor coeruleus TaxID=5963 RepID=A0A1R2BGG8_9CILI|nr:hypothetical protein SteCoe_24895 [Stentor coeruleus]